MGLLKKPDPWEGGAALQKSKYMGIKSRFLLTSSVVVVLIVVAIVLIFSLLIGSYYYSGMESSLKEKATASSDFFSSYLAQTYAEFYQSAYRYTESFEDRNSMELQFINTRGRVEVSSYGITGGSYPGTQDITDALATGEISPWTGRRPDTGERVMAVSAPLKAADGSVVGIMRFVTSLKLVDRQILVLTGIAALVGLAVILLVVLTSLYFIRSITEPVLALTAVARRIADGSYGIQAVKKHNDEIGTLTDAINEMSLRIGQAEKVQTEFISSVSHELRTPLTAITGWSETLAYDENIQGDSRRGVSIISKEASRLTKMVEELLEFTRIQDGRFNLNVETIDLTAELEDAIYTYGELLRQEGLTLRYTPAAEALPPILGDPERLKQVFLNILDNATKYGKNGKYIDVDLSQEPGEVVISIRDYGPGIPEEELPFVKQKFYKGSSKERGSGIGLAVCDEIVTRHRGSLILENAQGGGTRVTVRLPVPEEPLQREGAHGAQTP